MKKYHLTLIIAILSIGGAWAATPLTVDSCLSLVMKGNIALAAEKLNLSIADAEVRAARIFNDPSLGVEYADNDDHRMQMGRSVAVELGYTFTPGRRGAAIDLATSESQLAQALFDDYVRNLKYETLSAYFEAVKAHRMYHLAKQFSEGMRQIAEGDSVGFEIGETRKVDAMATGIEARVAASDARQALNDFHDAMAALALLMGNPKLAEAFVPVSEDMPMPLPATDDNALVGMALERRADLRAALKNVDVAHKALVVAGRERNLEFEVALGYNYNTEVRNEIAPAPRFSGVSIGVTIPLKFSNHNRGAINAAKFRKEQADLQYNQACMEVETDVLSSLRGFRTAQQRLAAVDQNTIAESESIYRSYLSAYGHGDVSLVELLEVRKSYEDLQRLYVENQCDAATSYARLQAALGL